MTALMDNKYHEIVIYNYKICDTRNEMCVNAVNKIRRLRLHRKFSAPIEFVSFVRAIEHFEFSLLVHFHSTITS